MTNNGGDTTSIAYQHLLYQLMHRPRTKARVGISLALTSVNAGEGVTSITGHLATALQEISIRRVLQVSVAMLEHELSLLTDAGSDRLHTTVRDSRHNTAEGVALEDSRYSRQECVRELSSRLDFLLIDCPALRQSGDVLSIASVVDGVVVVVEAGKTTKQDIAFAERQITASGGRLEGYILNHKRSPLSTWLRQMLS